RAFPARATIVSRAWAICPTSKPRRLSTPRCSISSARRSRPPQPDPPMHGDLDAHDADAAIFAPDAFGIANAEAELIARARRFGARVLALRAAQHDRAATFPIENFRDMHGEGLLGIC